MKVFITFSGERSRSVASALHRWIPRVLQSVAPWLSEEDIQKGKRWRPEVAKALSETHFGILCLTPDNLLSPWIHFEAGALAKSIEDAFLWTVSCQPE